MRHRQHGIVLEEKRLIVGFYACYF